MLTLDCQTELRVKAEALADRLWEQVKMTMPLGGTPPERIDQQDFYAKEVISCLSQRARRAEVDNADRLRERG